MTVIKIEQDYLKEIVLSIHHKGGVGGAFSQVVGGLTGGLIGRDPNREARREARRQEEMTRKRIEQEAKAREREEQFSKAVDKDKQAMVTEQRAVAKPEVSTDFSKAIKNKDDDEDKLKKSLKKAFRG